MDFNPDFDHVTRKISFNGWNLATAHLILKISKSDKSIKVSKSMKTFFGVMRWFHAPEKSVSDEDYI